MKFTRRTLRLIFADRTILIYAVAYWQDAIEIQKFIFNNIKEASAKGCKATVEGKALFVLENT